MKYLPPQWARQAVPVYIDKFIDPLVYVRRRWPFISGCVHLSREAATQPMVGNRAYVVGTRRWHVSIPKKHRVLWSVQLRHTIIYWGQHPGRVL